MINEAAACVLRISQFVADVTQERDNQSNSLGQIDQTMHALGVGMQQNAPLLEESASAAESV